MLTEEISTEMNNKFNSLSKAEKRVLIAKDVIAMVNAGKRQPITSFYLRINNSWDFSNNDSVQKIVDDISCYCCALGACLLSTIKYVNSVEFHELDIINSDSSEIWRLLKSLFTPKQMLLIEYAFESKESGDRVGEDSFKQTLTEKEVELSIKFGKRYFYSKDRLIAIMENIIKNKGTFRVK
jgi:hypothetical protein